MLVLGNIQIKRTEDGVVRLTVDLLHDIKYFIDDRLDQLEVEGDTLEEALINLHGQVEAILA